MYVPGVLGSQQRVSGPPELELQMNVIHHIGAGNPTQVYWKSSNALNY